MSNSKEEQTDLAHRARQGDQSAFAEIYREHYRAVYGYLRARMLDSATAEDMAQEVFLRAFRMIERFDPEASFKPWLMGIGRNVLREQYRKHGRRKEVAWTELCVELETMFGEETLYDDVTPFLPNCMNELGDSAKTAVKMHYVNGQKHKVIAEELNRSVGAIKVLMVRARQALKRCIEKNMPVAND